jgi:hypothetical protein
VTELSIFSDVVDRRLGRHVVHDEASWNYALPDVIAYGNARLPRAVQHARVIPVLDQGEVGSCTANALLGCLGTEPFASMLRDRDYAPVDLSTFDEALALAVYHDETILDEREIPGVYPPDDTGSAGLYAMKVARNRQGRTPRRGRRGNGRAAAAGPRRRPEGLRADARRVDRRAGAPGRPR